MAYEITRFAYDGAVDADGHVLEPGDLWESYIEERYRDRAIRIKRDGEGWEYLEVDGERLKTLQQKGLTFGAMGEEHVKPSPDRLWMDLMPYGACDPVQRLDLLERENLDHGILYPTLGLLWECQITDPEISLAYMRAYNRWIADFCRDSGGRLVPIAHLTLADPEGSAAELQRAVKDGCKGAFVAPFNHTRKPHGHTDHDVLFATAQALDVPIAIHVSADPDDLLCVQGVPVVASRRFVRTDVELSPEDLRRVAGAVLLSLRHACQEALLSFFSHATFDRFPQLKLGVLEAGAGWVASFLDRIDSIHKTTGVLGMLGDLKSQPSDYFRHQCFVSGDPEEFGATLVMEYVGSACFMWATDYPHPDHPATWVHDLKAFADRLAPEARARVLGQNAKDIYNLT